ncbi:MAG TPA: AraC family transcriptional regulator [Vicinamibacterales bacterium]
MDALSDVLRAVHLTGAVFFDVHASPPWVAASPPGDRIVRKIFPGADHLVFYHVVAQGTCWGGPEGGSPVALSAGDIVVFPRGDAHVMSSAPGMRGTPDIASYEPPVDGQLPTPVRLGEGATTAHVICGFLGCAGGPFNPLLESLPRVMRASDRPGGPIGAFLNLAIAESTQPRAGGLCMLGRLSELMFVEVIRRHLESMPADEANWLAGLRDPFVGKALAALHREPARDWTIDLLARDAGLSRSALADRFTRFVGQPPIQYLTNWRMQLAAADLRRGADSLAQIAERIGYESEAAFSRAFKKAVGLSPGRWRKEAGQAMAAEAALPVPPSGGDALDQQH